MIDIEPPQPAGQHFDWAALRYQHTAVIRAMLQTQTKLNETPWAPAYRNKHLVALRMALKHAFLLGRITPTTTCGLARSRASRGSGRARPGHRAGRAARNG